MGSVATRVRHEQRKRKIFPLFACATLALSLALIPVAAHAGPLDWVGGVTIGAVTSPIAIIAWIIFKIASILLGIAGIILNFVVAVLVFQFSTYLGNSQGMLLAWGILRDFANIGLLFGFIFLGIATILDLHSYPWKKTLPALVIYAVLLNFSLFITEAIIDGTNVLSATLYNATLADRDCEAGDGLLFHIECSINTGIAGQILSSLSVSSVMGSDDLVNNVINQITKPLENILKFLMLALLLTIAALVLFAGAFMLLSRAVILAFLMVTSPIGFAGMAIPGLKKIAQEWWHKLVNQALFAPVFLLLLLVALKMSQAMKSAFPGDLASAVSFTRGIQDAGPLFVYVLVIGFLLASLMIASRFGIYGADWAIKTAGGLSFGAVGGASRFAFGRPMSAAARVVGRSRWGTTTAGGRVTAKLLEMGATKSWDGRGTGPLKALMKGVKIDPGAAGDVAKKGRRGELEAAGKRANEDAKRSKDERERLDKQFDQRSKEWKDQEDLARSREQTATSEGRTADAAAYRAQAEHAKQQQVENEERRREVQLARLTPEERELHDYRNQGGAAAGEAQTAEANLNNASSQLSAASTALDAATQRLKELNAAKVAAIAGGMSVADADAAHNAGIAAAQNDVHDREEEREHWRREESNHREALKAAREQVTETKKVAAGMRDAKHAYDQVAASLDRMAGSLAGQALDPGALRAAAAAVRKERGKSHADHVLEELKEMMDGHGHGGGGGGGGGAAHGGGGGGGGAHPAPPAGGAHPHP